MPWELDRRAYFQLAVLFMALPLQYYFSTLSTSEERKIESLQEVWRFWERVRDTAMAFRPLKLWMDGVAVVASQLKNLLFRFDSTNEHRFGRSEEEEGTEEEEEEGESPAVEVLKHKFVYAKSGFFATSLTPRYPRPTHVAFRVGQVVRHRKWGYRGVIVGWDLTTRAPPGWIERNHEGNEDWSKQPNYAVLVDVHDRTIPQITYVPQENVEVVVDSRITHPAIEDYFEYFDGAQYLARPWLKTIYPMDG